MSWRYAVAGLAALLLYGCVSNPTPHPAQRDAGQTGAGGGADTVAPTAGKGPDRDGDGVPDCEAIGGVWDDPGSRCHYADGPPDGSDATDTEDGAVAGDAGDAAATDDAGRDALADEGDGPSPGTARRD